MLSMSVTGAIVSQSNLVRAVDLPGDGAAFIRCIKIGTGTYAVPWSFESYNNSPIFYVDVRLRATDSPDTPIITQKFIRPTFDYEDQAVIRSSSQFPLVRIGGRVVTPLGAITTNPIGSPPIRVEDFCPPPLP